MITFKDGSEITETVDAPRGVNLRLSDGETLEKYVIKARRLLDGR